MHREEYERAYEKLKDDRSSDLMVQYRAQLLAGDSKSALESARRHVSRNRQEAQPQAALVELLWLAEDHNAARQEFEKLRNISGSIDMASPVFTRLNPIAKELGLPSDWRLPSEPRDDIGERPPLDSLGPVHWSPPTAHNWELPMADGKTRSLKEFAGKPVVIIFYLGHACLHCAEQLQAFAPKYEEYQKAGIEMIAISTDDLKGLKISIDTYGDEPMPIPLVSNDKLDVFKKWRVYDDFEDLPLHGTFVIDPEGRILWQDISYEPFMDPDFVLNEAQRLLDQRRVESTPSTGPKKSISLKVPPQEE
jgi:peroxiredoxin